MPVDLGNPQPFAPGQALVGQQFLVPVGAQASWAKLIDSDEPTGVVADVEGYLFDTEPKDLTAQLIALSLSAENASPAFPSAQIYAHSYGAGAGAAASKYGQLQRTARELGVNFEGNTLSGGQVCAPASLGGVAALMQNPDFTTDLVRGPYVTPGGLKMCMMGFNDEPGLNPCTDGEAQVENGLTLAFSRMLGARVLLPLKRGAAGAGVALETTDVTFTGSWIANAYTDAVPSEGLGYAATTVVNDTADYALDSLYNGEALTAFFPIVGNVCRFTAEIRLDPAGANTLLGSKDFSQWQANYTTVGLGANGGIQCIRIPAGTISAGTHTIRVKITAITGGNAGTTGGLIIEGTAPLLVPVMPTFPTSASLTARAQWDKDRNTLAAAAFPSATVVPLEAALAPNSARYTSNDSLDLVAIDDANAYWSTVQAGHPNAAGYARCANLLIAAAKTTTLAKQAEMNSYQPSARALARWMKPNVGWVSSANKGVCENYDREDAATTLTLVTAKIYGMGRFTIPAGKIVAGLQLIVTTTGSAPSGGRWVALCRASDRVVIAVSLNSTTIFPSSEAPQWFTKPYMATDDVDVYALLGWVSTNTAPALATKALSANTAQRAPIISGTSTTAATATPPTAEVLAQTGLTPVTGTQLGVFTGVLASVPHATLLG